LRPGTGGVSAAPSEPDGRFVVAEQVSSQTLLMFFIVMQGLYCEKSLHLQAPIDILLPYISLRKYQQGLNAAISDPFFTSFNQEKGSDGRHGKIPVNRPEHRDDPAERTVHRSVGAALY
jgi:hypothetical protein